jgi:hypothetical protein
MLKAIVIHSLADARAALVAARDSGVKVTVISAPGAAAHAGAVWFDQVLHAAHAECPEAEFDAILDCDDAPGFALGALRAGIKTIRFAGREDVTSRLAGIAAANGARLVTEPVETLDLRGHKDPASACRAWLDGDAHA